MSESETLPIPGMIEPEVLVATCFADGSVHFRNEAWIRILGSESDLWSRLIEADRKTAEQNFKEACGGTLVTHALLMARQRDHDLPAPVLLNFIPVMSRGGSHDAGSNVVAITGEVLTEPDSWTENQTDRHRMETLGRMTMGITHDFNNLLSGILGHISILESKGLLQDATSEMAEHVATIKKAASGGAALVNKIQRYIRQEKKAAFESVNLSTLIQDCVILTKPYWYNEPRRQGIEINVTYDVPEELRVLGSSPELRDVLVNLLLNAVQAMPEGGQISISARSSEGFASISVRDTGMGMMEEIRSRIFEPLFTTKTGSGSGMGLSVALGIIQEHEGTISVSSEWRKGTRFDITLPLFHEACLREDAKVTRTEQKSVSILVVDDEEMVLKVITTLLNLRGHQVSAVSSAIEALELLDHSTFDIIISDQGMPAMNGRDFAKEVRQRHGEVPFVLLTGDTDISADPRSINRVVSKPFKIEELDTAIHELT